MLCVLSFVMFDVFEDNFKIIGALIMLNELANAK